MVNPWRLAGGYLDTTTGLYKFGARYYEPGVGRWTQQDPSGMDANPYAYVGGDPVNSVDPGGRSKCGDFSVGGFVDCAANPTELVPTPEAVSAGSVAAGTLSFSCTVGTFVSGATIAGAPAAAVFSACAVGAGAVGTGLGVVSLFYD